MKRFVVKLSAFLMSVCMALPMLSGGIAAENGNTALAVETDAEAGAALRESIKLKVGDIVCFGDTMYLYDTDGNIVQADPGENVYIIGIDDENQRFRALLSENSYVGIPYLYYEDAKDTDTYTYILSHQGMAIGDLNDDETVDVFDLGLMKYGLIYGWNDAIDEYLADMNDDSQVTVADIVWLQKWLLGIPNP